MLCHRGALTLPLQRADFAVAACWLCHRSVLRRGMQYDPLRFLPFQPCIGRTLLFSSRSVPLSQEPSSLLHFGSPAIPSIPHWFKFAMACIPQTGILLLFGHDFGIFIPVACVISMRKHHFYPQKPYLGGEKCLLLQVLSPKSTFWSTSFFLKGGWRIPFRPFDVRKRVFHWCVSFPCYNRISPIVFFRHKVLSE